MDNIIERKKNIFEKIKYVFSDKKLYIFILITFVFYIGLSKLSFTRCTYRMYFYDWKEEFTHYIGIGRCITAFSWALVSILKLKLSTVYIGSYLIAIFSIAFSMYKLYFIIYKLIKEIKLSIITSVLIILNSYLIDYFIYLEKGIMTFSVLMAVVAICNIDKFFDTKKKKYIIYALISLLFVNLSYQASGGLFVVFSLFLILKNSSNILKFLKNNILIAMIYGIPLSIDYLIVKLTYTTERNSGNINIIESTKNILNCLKYMIIDTYAILPKYFFLIVLILFILLFLILFFNKKVLKNILLKECKINNSVKIIFGFIYVIFGNLFISIFPQYSLSTSSVWLTPRATYIFASIIGFIILYISFTMKLRNTDKKIINIIAIIYIIVEIINIHWLIQDFYKVNEIDKITAILVENEIQKYEKDNNIKVENVTFYSDRNVKNSYPEIRNFSEINQKIITKTWRNLSLLGYYTGRKLDLRKSFYKEEYNEYFSENDWEYFDNEQLKFDGNTLHWCMF